ncbi:MAG: ROK family protein [Hyphomicrobiaceae bacterium]
MKSFNSLPDAARSDDLRRRNRQRVLGAVRDNAVLSRSDISSFTGLSAATVSAITSDLIAEDVLMLKSANSAAAMGRGRPKVELGLNPSAGVIAAMNLQLNFASAAIVDYATQTQAHVTCRIDSYAASARKIRSALVRCLKDALKEWGGDVEMLRRIVVGVQGTTDVAGTSLLWSPITRHRNLPVQSWLQSAFGVPAIICNDADLIALALNHSEPDRYGPNFAAILLAHGVGMGLFLRGQPVYGTKSSGAEFGHMIYMPDGALCRCGSRGCIEAYAGDYAILRRARGEQGSATPVNFVEDTDIAEIVRAAEAGDACARAAIETAGAALGGGLASLYALVDPFPIVLIGNGTLTCKVIEPAIRQAIAKSKAVLTVDEGQGDVADQLKIDYILDGETLVQRGGVVQALKALDHEFVDAVY